MSTQFKISPKNAPFVTARGYEGMGVDEFKDDFEKWKKTQSVTNISELHTLFSNYLYLEPPDHEALEVVLSGAFDRLIPGDPTWFYLIGPPASMKTEVINSCSLLPCVYSLDTLTPQTFVSGLTKKNAETGEPEPIGGLLKKMNGKTLMVKDFTTILQGNKDNREEIFGQLRSIYDGKFEKGFGTLPDPIRVNARIGLVQGVTPVIDKYTSLQNLLGERNLKIRINPNPLEATKKAMENEGKEATIRQALSNAVICLYEHLDFNKIPSIPSDYESEIIGMGMYIATMRANVWKQYNEQGQLIDANLLYREIPTRVSKQLKHTAKLLAIIRGRTEVTEAELATLARIVKDTADQRRQGVVEAFNRIGRDSKTNSAYISGQSTNLFRQNVTAHLMVLEELGAVHSIDEGDVKQWYLDDNFKAWVQCVYKNRGEGAGESQTKLDIYPPPPLPVTKEAEIQPRSDHEVNLILKVANAILTDEGGSVGNLRFMQRMENPYGFIESQWMPILKENPRYEVTDKSVSLRGR